MGHEELWFDIGQVEKMKRVKRSIRDNRHELSGIRTRDNRIL